MQTEHSRTKVIKNSYVPSEIPGRGAFRTMFR